MITRADLDWWLDFEPELDWQFATTYADGAPHEYVAAPRTQGLNDRDYVRAAHVIQTYGTPMKFYKQTRIYLTTSMGWKHWTMDRDLDDTRLVNRGRVEHVYGVQNMPTTRSGVDSAYDKFASTWDTSHGMTESERVQIVELIRRTFGDKLGRTLDVGCGTGWPVTAGLTDPVRYVGVDPSTGMLNALIARHATVAGVHPMTWGDAVRNRVLCGTTYDTVLSLGGAASYLSPLDLGHLQSRARRGALLMNYEPSEQPITCDLDPVSAAQSLAAVSRVAAEQTPVGRFVTSFVPAGAAGETPQTADRKLE